MEPTNSKAKLHLAQRCFFIPTPAQSAPRMKVVLVVEILVASLKYLAVAFDIKPNQSATQTLPSTHCP